MKKVKTIEEQRIEILEDVLKHIDAGRIKAKPLVVLAYDKIRPERGNLKTILKKYSRKKKVCNVCQRGALLFASVWKNNNLNIKHWSDNSEFTQGCLLGTASLYDETDHGKYLNKLFPIHQQQLMETAFEGRYHEYHLSGDYASCIFFYNKYKKPLTRMKAIVNNAIKNGGIFKP